MKRPRGVAWSSGGRFAFALVFTTFASAASCAAEPIAPRSWPATDTADVGEPFDANFLLADQDLEDGTFLDGDAIQAFFVKPPYGPPSFLSTYVEKGRRAADLVASSAARHRVSALWLLARLERDGLLVATRRYPADAKDVEYVFDYGCSGRRLCDPTFGGLGVQVDALAADVRRALDDVRRSAVSVNGFGAGVEARTLDNVRVTPANAGTAALYAVEPVVAGPGGGQALTWRIYRVYANHVAYFPLGPGQP